MEIHNYITEEQPFPAQFTKDGINKVKTVKSSVKDHLLKEFGLKGQKPVMTDYEGICVDANHSLYRTPPENCNNVHQITAWYVAKVIKPLIHSNVTVIMCFDKGPLVTFMKGQGRPGRLERSNKSKVP